MASSSSRTKKSGVSEAQKGSLLTYLEENIFVARNQFPSGVDGAKELQRRWDELSKLLNSTGGASKSPREWRKCWADLRNATRKRYMTEKSKRNQSGVNDIIECLSEFDQRVIGIVTIEGIDGDMSQEHGIPSPANEAQSPQSPEDDRDVEARSDVSVVVPETTNPQTPQTARGSNKRRSAARSLPKSRDEEETEMMRNLLTIKKRKLEILEESHETNKQEQQLRMELMRAKINAYSRQN